MPNTPTTTPATGASHYKELGPWYSRGRKSRGRGLRKTTGCLTCRRRHVSCDELKPVCSGCSRIKQACIYRSQNTQNSRNSADTIDVAASSTTTTTTTTSRRRGGSDGGVGGVDHISAPVLPGLPAAAAVGEDEDGGMTDASQQQPPLQQQLDDQLDDQPDDQRGNQLEDQRQDADTGPVLEAAASTALASSAPGFSVLRATATATATATVPQTTGAPSAVPIPQTTPQTAGTPSTTYSLQLSPSQARHNYAPSVSSGRVSVSQDLFGGASAGSIFSIVPNIESATAQWLGLLIGDATQDAGGGLPAFEWEGESGGLDVFGNSVAADLPLQADDVPSLQSNSNSNISKSNPGLQERFPRLVGEQQLFEMQAWHSAIPIELMPHEHFLFQHFVMNICCMMDLFDPKNSFGTFVPHLAMHNVGLINAILALSARHLSLKAKGQAAAAAAASAEETSSIPSPPNPPNPNEAIRYYYKTLHYIQKAMEYDTYKTSLELLATSIIVSTYEMLDGSRKDWERHLKGVFLIQRSQVIHGDSGGLRQAVWWSWLCQDVWAAFRERRKPLTFWQPTRRLDELDPYELAARSVFYFAHVVAFCSAEEMEKHRASPAARMAKADALLESLEDWRLHHTVEFDPLPTATHATTQRLAGGDNVFQPLWIHPPAFGVAVQLYYCALILIALNRPLVGDLDAYLQQRKAIQRYVSIVCGIAMTLTEDASSVMCSQCLYIAGLSIEDPNRQLAVLDLLERCRQRAVWPASPLGDELARKWQESS